MIDVLNDDFDSNLLSLKKYQASTDFFVSASNPIIISKAGTIFFSGLFEKPVTSDHVTLKIIKNVAGSTIETILFQKTFLATEIANFDLSSLSFTIPDDNSFIKMEIETATNIRLKDLKLNASVTIPAIPNSKPEDNIKKLDVSHSFYKKTDGNYIMNEIKSTLNEKLKLTIDPENFELVAIRTA